MRATILSILMLAAAIGTLAQSTVAPTNDPTQSPNGTNWENYNITQSYELGYRYDSVGGSMDMYRSTVNFTNGIRLLSSSFAMQSREGHGTWFDTILLNTQGLGNDPYESAVLRIAKNRLYKYDMIWRENQYFDPGITLGGPGVAGIGYGHLQNTTRTFQDHDLTLFPESSLKIFMGFSRNLETGPELSSVQPFTDTFDIEPLFSNVHRLQNEYRLGGEMRLMGFRLNILHGWQDFKEDTPVSLAAPILNPANGDSLTSFAAAAPYHGTSPYWRVGLFREGKRLWAFNGRFTYVGSRRDFAYDELSTGGTSFFGVNRQVISYGDATRPSTAADANLSFFPASHLTITNQTSFSQVQISGDSVFEELNFATLSVLTTPFDYLGILTVSNSTVAEWRPRKYVQIHAGYEFDDRRIRSIENTLDQTSPFAQSNQLHAGTFGVRLRPIERLTVSLDGEIGRESRPIFPISDRDYQAFRGRVEYKHKSLRAGVYARSDYNTNSISLTSYASHARQYGADFTWTANQWFSIDASYAKLHLNTLGGIDYFASGQNVTGESSLYISNIHTGTLGARFALGKRADFYVGYSHVQDVGDGRSTPDGAGLYSALSVFEAAQTFPLRFVSPQARLSVLVRRQVRWNLGYQYYGYRQQFSALDNYLANTGYSSIAWSF